MPESAKFKDGGGRGEHEFGVGNSIVCMSTVFDNNIMRMVQKSQWYHYIENSGIYPLVDMDVVTKYLFLLILLSISVLSYEVAVS